MQTLSGSQEPFIADAVAGFSQHASVALKVGERKKLERICRYISRPAVSENRLSLTHQGKVRYQLKTPYRHGRAAFGHVIFEPVDFMAKLTALVPRPRVNRTGPPRPATTAYLLLTAHAEALVTPARRGKRARRDTTQQGQGERTNQSSCCHDLLTKSQADLQHQGTDFRPF